MSDPLEENQLSTSKNPVYLDISDPFQWGDRQVCYATEWLGVDRTRLCILDAETHQQIETIGIGEDHALHGVPFGPYIISRVVNEEEKPTTITWNGDLPPDTTLTIEHH